MSALNDVTWESIATASDIRNEPRHRWYWVKEGFSPFLVQTAIKSEGCVLTDLVVDPFCGSGTVPLESARCQMPSAATEVNPFLAFAAITKTLTATESSVSLWCERATQSIHRGNYSPLIGFSTFAKTKQHRGLFNQSVLKGFRGAWRSLEPAPDTTRKLLRLCLLRSILDCANFSRDGKALRYRETLIERQFGRKDLDAAFSCRVADLVTDISSDHVALVSPHIELADSRSKPLEHFRGFKLCVTSPPYLNSFDYTDVYRPELFLGEFVRSPQDLRELRHRTVRSHVQASWKLPVESDFGPMFLECHEAIKAKRARLWDKRIPEMVQGYFEDIRVVLGALRSVARPDAVVWLVVSTSAYAGVEIPVDLIVAHLGTQVGWSLREVRVLRHLRSSGQHQNKLSSTGREYANPLRESLVILDANPT